MKLAKVLSTCPGIPDGSSKRNLIDAALVYRQAADTIKALEQDKRAAGDRLLYEMDKHAWNACVLDTERLTAKLTVVTVERTTVSAERLLELGVDPEIIRAASRWTVTRYVRVTELEA